MGGLAIVGMGFAVGCSAKQAPAPNDQTESHIDSKRPKGESGAKSDKNDASFKPEVKAPAAPTAKPGDN